MQIKRYRFRRYKSLLHQPHRQISRLHLRNNPCQRSSSLILRMSSDVIPSGGLSRYFLRNSSILVFNAILPFYGKIIPQKIMQRNTFREIWTWLSHRVLRGIRVCGCNRVQVTPFYARMQDIPKGHNQKK